MENKEEVSTPGGVKSYWAVDYCLAMDFTEEDWGEFQSEVDEIMLQNLKGESDANSK